MGTSTNHGSSRLIPSWGISRASLGTRQVPLDRQANEIWKSASADKEANLALQLSSVTVSHAAELAASSAEPAIAVRMFDDALDEHQDCGVVYDIARRALLRATRNKSGAEGFTQELFAEAANYYVSRDLPSLVAAKGRVATTSEALEVKDGIRELTRQVVAPLAVGLSDDIRERGALDTQKWRVVVGAALTALQGRGAK